MQTEKETRKKKYSKEVTCVRGHTAPFVEVFLSDPKYRIWTFVCQTCGTGVFWSGASTQDAPMSVECTVAVHQS